MPIQDQIQIYDQSLWKRMIIIDHHWSWLVNIIGWILMHFKFWWVHPPPTQFLQCIQAKVFWSIHYNSLAYPRHGSKDYSIILNNYSISHRLFVSVSSKLPTSNCSTFNCSSVFSPYFEWRDHLWKFITIIYMVLWTNTLVFIFGTEISHQ